MNYMCVRTYGNGKYMNKIIPLYFEYLSQAEKWCEKLNHDDVDKDSKWIVMPLTKYQGKVWDIN